MKIINLDRDEKKIGLSIKAILLDESKKKKRKPKPKKEDQPKVKVDKKEGTINIGDLIGDKLSSLRVKSIESDKSKEKAAEPETPSDTPSETPDGGDN